MFQNLPMLQNTIGATNDAMSILAADAQAFQTDGYKQTRYSFSTMFTSALNQIGGKHGNSAMSTNHTIPKGVTLVPMGYDMSQGGIRSAQPLNAAISGQGFFVMQPDNANTMYLTRASDFIFAADGTLSDVFGKKLKGYKMVNGQADKSELVDVVLDPDEYNLADVGFEDDGILTTNYQARAAAREENQDLSTLPEGEQTFQLALAFVPNPALMDSNQGNTFTTNLRSGSISYLGTSNENAFGSVIGGSTEASNVNPAETTIVGIQLQRSYNAVQGALQMTNKFLTQIMDIAGKA